MPDATMSLLCHVITSSLISDFSSSFFCIFADNAVRSGLNHSQISLEKKRKKEVYLCKGRRGRRTMKPPPLPSSFFLFLLLFLSASAEEEKEGAGRAPRRGEDGEKGGERRCPRPDEIAPCQCRTRGPTIQVRYAQEGEGRVQGSS